MRDKISEGLDRIDKSLIRNEFNMRIYADYFLPCLRFHLTVNDMCSSHLTELDSLANRFLKKWSGLPHPATLAFLYLPNGLAIKKISDLYLECHTTAHISSRLKGDDTVNHCIDSRLEREGKWSSKISIVKQSEEILLKSRQNSTDLKSCQKTAKKIMKENVSDFWHAQVKPLLVQGRFLDLMCIEAKSYQCCI